MKYATLILLLALMLTACDSQNSATVVDDVIIEVTVEPNPPNVGESTLLVSVRSADDTAIDNAIVSVHGDMDHEGMTPVDGETSESVNGVYAVPFEWTMGGGWILNVTVNLPDNRGIATAQFEQFVGAISQDSIVNRATNDSGFNIRFMSDNDPAIAGDATVTIFVTDAEGHPVNDATVSLFATMPEHEMMPVSEESTTPENGRYLIPLRWTMAGDWRVEITVTLDDGQSITESYDLTIVMPEQ